MPAKSIPYMGEFVQSYDYPAPLRMARVLVGAGADNDVQVTAQATYEIVSLPAGAVVFAVLARVITAFTTSVTLTIGDGTSAAGYFASADIAPQTAVTTGLVKNSTSAGEALAGGKHYLTADTIDIVVGGANPTAGQMEVFVLYAIAGGD